MQKTVSVPVQQQLSIDFGTDVTPISEFIVHFKL